MSHPSPFRLSFLISTLLVACHPHPQSTQQPLVATNTQVPVAPESAPVPVAPESAPVPVPAPVTATNNAAAGIDPAVAKLIREVATQYQSMSRVDEHPSPAPYLCAMPPPARASQVRMSTSEQGHARKLYYLFSSRPSEYLRATDNEHPAETQVGHVLVKESWMPVAINTPARPDPVPHVRQLQHADPIRETTVKVSGIEQATGSGSSS